MFIEPLPIGLNSEYSRQIIEKLQPNTSEIRIFKINRDPGIISEGLIQ